MFAFLVNTATVIVGSSLGLLFGPKLKEKYKSIVLYSLGLVTIVIGVSMAIKSKSIMLIVGSMILGALGGQWLAIEERLEKTGEYIKKRAGSSAEQFALGFVTASLLFCVGPMTVVGSVEDGLYGKGELIYIKSLMDGFASIALSAALGAGVLFSAIIVLVYQGALTFLARYLQGALSEPVVNEMSAAGGVIVIGIGINVLGLARIKVGNMIPALPIAAVLAWLTMGN